MQKLWPPYTEEIDDGDKGQESCPVLPATSKYADRDVYIFISQESMHLMVDPAQKIKMKEQTSFNSIDATQIHKIPTITL